MRSRLKIIKEKIAQNKLNDRADVAVELIMKMILTIFLIYTFLQIIPIITIHTNMSHVAEALARTVELTGQVNSPQYQNQLTMYGQQWSFPMNVTVEPDDTSTGWFDQSQGKLAFRAPFTLQATTTYTLRIINTTLSAELGAFDIPISKTVYGTSEIYWKE